jgi:hypothetical protein
MPSTTSNQVQHSSSSSALRTPDYQHPVTYIPQATVPSAVPSCSHSVRPLRSCIPEQLPVNVISNRQPTNTNYPSTTSVNSTTSGPIETLGNTSTKSIPLTRKTITEYPKGTYRVVFSDNSVMIIYAECTDGQIFIDTQGNRYSFDRRQQNQPESIQERLALMYQDEHELVYSTTAS